MKKTAIFAFILAGFFALAPRSTAVEPVRIVILPFENATGQKARDPLREGIADLLTVCFTPFASQVAVVDRSVLAQITKEQSLSKSNLVSDDTWQKVGQLSGATHLLRGNFSQSPEGLKVQGLLYDVGSTQLVLSTESSGGTDGLTDILCDGVARALVVNLNEGAPSQPPLPVDTNPVYSHLMITGMGHYYNGNLADAFPAFMKALRNRPDDEPAQYWLARSFFDAKLMNFAAVELRKYLVRFPENKRRDEVEALLQEAVSRNE